jgi:hypothetical protein
MLDESLAAFLQEGLAIHIGTRNARLEPNGARVPAVTVDEDRRHVVVYVPQAAAPPILADLRANGQAAIGFARPVDDKACQVKGVLVEEWIASDAEQAEVMRQWRGNLAQLSAVGIPEVASTAWSIWPCAAVRVRVTELFDQTPGPGAGKSIA